MFTLTQNRWKIDDVLGVAAARPVRRLGRAGGGHLRQRGAGRAGRVALASQAVMTALGIGVALADGNPGVWRAQARGGLRLDPGGVQWRRPVDPPHGDGRARVELVGGVGQRAPFSLVRQPRRQAHVEDEGEKAGAGGCGDADQGGDRRRQADRVEREEDAAAEQRAHGVGAVVARRPWAPRCTARRATRRRTPR